MHAADRVLPYLLVGFAFALAVFEGPAQLLCGLALLAAFASGRLRGYRPGIIEVGILVWAAAGFVGHIGFEGRTSSADTTRPLLALALFVGIAYTRASNVTLERAAWVFAVGLTVNGAYGLLQFTVGELPLDAWLLPNPKSGQIWIPGRVFHERASSGLFYNRLRLAHVGVAGLALVVLAMVVTPKKSTRLWSAAGAVVLGAGVLFTYARMAMLALVVGLAIVLVMSKVRWRTLAGLAVAGTIALVGFLSTPFGRRRIESLAPDLEIRRAMVEAAWKLVESHPVFGVGHGIYRSAVLPHMPANLSGVTATSPHNQFLQVLAETGVVGLIGFSVAILGALFLATRALNKPAEPHQRTLRRLAFTVLVMQQIIGLTHFALHHGSVGLITWTAVGIAIGSTRGGSLRDAHVVTGERDGQARR